MSSGIVVVCQHCKGDGSCVCAACMKVYNINQQNEKSEKGPCGACMGAGKIWVGPQFLSLTKES